MFGMLIDRAVFCEFSPFVPSCITNMSTIPQLFGGRAPQSDSDNIVLAPPSINPRSEPSLQPDEFRLQGKVYVRCCSLAKNPKATKRRQSIIWTYGEDIQLQKTPGKRFWYCYLCEKKRCQQELPIVDKGNSTALDHIKQKHQIDQTGGSINCNQPGQRTICTLGSSIARLVFQRDLDAFKELFIRWIVYCHVAFFQMENDYFRELLFYLTPVLADLLPKAAKTIRKWVKDEFLTRKEALRKELIEAEAVSPYHLMFGQHPAAYAILGAVAHFVDNTGKRRSAVLGLRQLHGTHTARILQGSYCGYLMNTIFEDGLGSLSLIMPKTMTSASMLYSKSSSHL